MRLVVEIDVTDLSPREVRTTFVQALRDAVAQGCLRGAIDQAVGEELFRSLPAPAAE